MTALTRLRHEHDLGADDIDAVEVADSAIALEICSYSEPEDELQAKFSMVHAAAVALGAAEHRAGRLLDRRPRRSGARRAPPAGHSPRAPGPLDRGQHPPAQRRRSSRPPSHPISPRPTTSWPPSEPGWKQKCDRLRPCRSAGVGPIGSSTPWPPSTAPEGWATSSPQPCQQGRSCGPHPVAAVNPRSAPRERSTDRRTGRGGVSSEPPEVGSRS